MYDEPLFTGRRFRLFPKPKQAKLLAQWIGCARVIYNGKVAEMLQAFTDGELFQADMCYSHLKTDDKPWLKEVPPEILRNAVYHFKSDFQRYRKKLARRPTFHKKWEHDSVWLTKELFSFEEDGRDADGRVRYKLIIGKPGYEIGEVEFTAHRMVTFEPGARTNWHTHPLGQTLIVTSGVGQVQFEDGPTEEIRLGDAVWIPPHTRHWHGASPTRAMTHIAIAESFDEKAVEWLEPVSDEQYQAG